MGTARFSFGEHIAERRHLLTEENLRLFDELRSSLADKSAVEQCQQIQQDICTIFEIPIHKYDSPNKLIDSVEQIRLIIDRMRIIDDRGLSENKKVTIKNFPSKYIIRLIQKDFLLRIPGIEWPILPENVWLA